uniref:RNA polymerase I subunit E n=1 Tax=Sphenodon punctatus TaxID=8508 RepID=A0A8D0GXP7_SPHPU
MAAFASWCYREDPHEEERAPLPLVQFSNGKLKSSKNMDFTLYRSKDINNPRKKHRRILTTETDRLSYVGNNFGTGALKCNTLCRYYVGILDKDSEQMDVYNAELFKMQPLVLGNIIEDDPSDYQNKSYREKVDSCIEAFGTSKQKRALNSRRMNQVESESLNKSVAKAAENIIDAKGVTALVNDAAQDDLEEVSLFLPPCHKDADKREDVYKFEDILSPAEYEALQTPAAAFINVTSEEIFKRTQEKSNCSFVLEELKSMPLNENSRDHKARCLWFLDILINLSFQKVIKKKYALGPDCPHIINNKLMKNFTSFTYNNGRIQNLISASMKTKITAYVIALALHINGFQTDLTILQKDMRLRENRILEIAKAMRLKISKRKGLAADEDHKLATLSLHLPVYKPLGGQKKRRKMN